MKLALQAELTGEGKDSSPFSFLVPGSCSGKRVRPSRLPGDWAPRSSHVLSPDWEVSGTSRGLCAVTLGAPTEPRLQYSPPCVASPTTLD